MKKSKKGFTLIELMIGMLVLAVAILAGSQMFSAAARGYSSSVRLASAVNTLASVYDTAPALAQIPQNVTLSEGGTAIKLTLPNGKTYTESGTSVSLLYNDGKIKVKLFGLKNSYGNGK